MTEVTKLILPKGQEPTEIEKQVAGALADLEVNSDIKAELRELFIVGVTEYADEQRRAIVIWVPVPLQKQFQKVQARLIRELEKKFGGKHVIFVSKRTILRKPQRGNKAFHEPQKRPRSRTLTAVHNAWLEDVCFPAEVVGRRIRFKLDGSILHKVHLDKGQQTNVEHKVDTFAFVYKELTNKTAVFEFPEPIF